MVPAGKRWLIPMGVVAAVMMALAPSLPAAAQESQPVKLSMGFPNMTIAPGTEGSSASIMLWADVKEETSLEHFRFAIDGAGLNGVATVEPLTGFDCTTAGTVETCGVFLEPVVRSAAAGAAGTIICVRPAAGAKIGERGTVTLTVSADNASSVTVTSTITIGEAVDMVNVADVTVEGRPGGSVTASLGVRNAGETSVQGVDLLFFQGEGAELDRRYTNCEYNDLDAICHFDTTLQPGAEYALSEPVTIHVGKDAWAPGELIVVAQWLTPADQETRWNGLPQRQRTHGTAGQLTLESAPASARARALSQTDLRNWDNFADITIKVSGDNQADFAAVGATAHGGVGTVVTVDVGVKNLGPASVNFRSGDPVQTVQLDVPDGTTVVSVSKECLPVESGGPVQLRFGQPGAKRYWCYSDRWFPVGKTESWTFGLRIDKKIDNATGTVTINVNYADPADPHHDTNPANDTARLVINPVGGSGGGTAILPVTGGRVGVLIGTAAMLLVVGAVVFVSGRRRRTRFVAER